MSKVLKVSMEIELPDNISNDAISGFFENVEQDITEYLDGELPEDCDGVIVSNFSIFNKHRRE